MPSPFRGRMCDVGSRRIFGEDDFHYRESPGSYLEHRRLEIAALRLRSTRIDTCVIGVGIPYGIGEGPLLRMFQEAWRGSDSFFRIPTFHGGDNKPGLIHVRDLSSIVGALLASPEHGGLPAPFPKPYILAVDGDDAQASLKEIVTAIGEAFGVRGETQPMEADELEDFLVDNPSALALLSNVRFSNEGGVLADMVAKGASCMEYRVPSPAPLWDARAPSGTKNSAH